jgi:hypothetical protein
MLTAGVMLPVLGALWFTTDSTSPYRRAGEWVPFTLIAVGVVVLLLGILNVLHVRAQLRSHQR